MLTHLQLRDLVLVDQAELELKAGLTALTGETGAGKSIVVDALLLIAGGRPRGERLSRGAVDRTQRRSRVAAGDRRGRPLPRLCERPGGAYPGTARTGG